MQEWTLEDKTKGPAIEDWDRFLRNYPGALRTIIDSVQTAQNLEEARIRTVAIWKWLHQSRLELCELITDVEDDSDTQVFGIQFGDSHYGTHDAPNQMARNYFDPLFAQAVHGNMMAGGRYAQFEHHGDQAHLSLWHRRVKQAEAQFFTRQDAPILALRAEWPKQVDRPVIEWEATEEILALTPRERILDGWRQTGFPADLLGKYTPPEVSNYRGNVHLRLLAYQPSAQWIAEQRARDIHQSTTTLATHLTHPRL